MIRQMDEPQKKLLCKVFFDEGLFPSDIPINNVSNDLNYLQNE